MVWYSRAERSRDGPSLSSQTSPKKRSGSPSRKANARGAQHFIQTLHIKSYDELRQVDHRAVIDWERIMREIDGAGPSTVRRRLASLSSLFKHLVRHNHVEINPVAAERLGHRIAL